MSDLDSDEFDEDRNGLGVRKYMSSKQKGSRPASHVMIIYVRDCDVIYSRLIY